MRHLSEFCHAACPWRRVVRNGCPAIADLVEIVVPASTGFGQSSTSPFDFEAVRGFGEARAPAPGGNGSSQISPATMSALLAAQSQSSAAAGTTAPTSRSEALNHLFSQIDARWRRQDQQIGIRKRAWRRRHQCRPGRRCVRQARQEWRRFGQPRRIASRAEGRQGSPSLTIMPRLRRDRAMPADQVRQFKLRSIAAGFKRRILQLGHQQRRLDHDLGDLCRRIEGDDDIARGEDGIRQSRHRPTISSSR